MHRLVPTVVTLLVATTLLAAGTAVAQDAQIDYDGEAVTLENAPDQVISGQTTLDEGDRVVVRLRSSNAENPFLITSEATVEEDGRFAASVDMSSTAPGTPFEVSVRYNGTEIASADGEVIECTEACTATASETEGDGTVTATDELDLPRTVVQVSQHDTARIPVSLGDADAATLAIGGDAVNYRINATVRDGDGDGLVVVLFDTGAAGVDGRTLSTASDGDDLSLVGSETDLDSSIDPASYDLALYRGTEPSGSPAAIGTLVLTEGDPGTEVATGTVTDGSTTVEESADASGERTDSTTATETVALDDGTPATRSGLDVGGIGALAAGGLLAVAAVAVLLGVTRF